MDDETWGQYVSACKQILRVQRELERTGEQRATWAISAAMAHLEMVAVSVHPTRLTQWERAIYGG